MKNSKPEPVKPEEKSEAKRLLDLFFENRPDEDRRYSEVVILELMEAYRRKPVLHDDQDPKNTKVCPHCGSIPRWPIILKD